MVFRLLIKLEAWDLKIISLKLWLIIKEEIFTLFTFFLGLIGLLYQLKKNKNDAISCLLIIPIYRNSNCIYLNVVPFQPRERDYAYVGSFYAYAIWIGLGVLAIIDFLSKNSQR